MSLEVHIIRQIHMDMASSALVRSYLNTIPDGIYSLPIESQHGQPLVVEIELFLRLRKSEIFQSTETIALNVVTQ